MEGRLKPTVATIEQSDADIAAALEAMDLQAAHLRRVQAERAAAAELLIRADAPNILVPESPSPTKKRVMEEHSRKALQGIKRPRAPAFGPSKSIPEEDTFLPRPVVEPPLPAHLMTAPSKSNLLRNFKDMENSRGRDHQRKVEAESRSLTFGVKAKKALAATNPAPRVPSAAARRGITKGMSDVKPSIPSRIIPTSSSEFALSLPLSTGRPPSSRKTVEEQDEDDDEDGLDIEDAPGPSKRNHDLTVKEELVQGPVFHKPIPGDPNFETVEPNSGIRLRRIQRQVSHEDLQEHLTNRYHLTPAQVYSYLRPGPTPGSHDVNVVGDFVVIGVLAWKGEVRYMHGDALKKQEKEDEKKRRLLDVKGVEGIEEEEEKVVDELFRPQKKTKKYLRFTVVDLGSVDAAASGTGTMHLMLFEADEHTEITREDGTIEHRYKGGSGGAYEKHWKESAGAVVAILNPRILKIRKIESQQDILTITPESAESMLVIGRAKDLRSCDSIMRGSGLTCGNWVDARVHTYCEYHVQTAVKRTAASRPETYQTNASMGKTASFDSKAFAKRYQPTRVVKGGAEAPCDRENKIGLLPRTNIRMIEGATTYVTAGSGTLLTSLSASSGKSKSSLGANGMRAAALQSGNGSGGYIAGVRDGPTVKQAELDVRERRLKKQLRQKDAEELMERDGGRTLGARYLKDAQRAREDALDREFRTNSSKSKEKGKGKDKPSAKEEAKLEKERNARRKRGKSGSDESDHEVEKKRRGPFGTTAVRLIGYDPSRQADQERPDEDDETRRQRLQTISSLANNHDRPEPKLNAPPGVKVRSGVIAPIALKPIVASTDRPRKELPLEEDEDDLVIEGRPSE